MKILILLTIIISLSSCIDEKSSNTDTVLNNPEVGVAQISSSLKDTHGEIGDSVYFIKKLNKKKIKEEGECRYTKTKVTKTILEIEGDQILIGKYNVPVFSEDLSTCLDKGLIEISLIKRNITKLPFILKKLQKRIENNCYQNCRLNITKDKGAEDLTLKATGFFHSLKVNGKQYKNRKAKLILKLNTKSPWLSFIKSKKVKIFEPKVQEKIEYIFTKENDLGALNYHKSKIKIEKYQEGE